MQFQNEFALVANVDGQITAIVGFFDVEFQSVPHRKSFTTSPHNIPTHWKQAVFLLQDPISVIAGECTECPGETQHINTHMFVMSIERFCRKFFYDIVRRIILTILRVAVRFLVCSLKQLDLAFKFTHVAQSNKVHY